MRKSHSSIFDLFLVTAAIVMLFSSRTKAECTPTGESFEEVEEQVTPAE